MNRSILGKRTMLIGCLLSSMAYANEETSAPSVCPGNAASIWELPSGIWGGMGTFVRRIDPKENYPFLLGMTAGTLLLVKYDQKILNGSQKLARHMGLISDEKNGREGRTILDLSALGLDMPIRVPANTNSALYFLGDGLTHVSIAGGLALYGSINDDNRSRESAREIMESIISTGIIVQILKRSTGRESPFASTADGGRWRPFPSPATYNENVPHYDAYPSGHLATAMATVTVLAGNYPEKTYIRPVGYTLMALNAFGMMNNGVHWASDYPLGIAIGWLAADIALERGRKRRQQPQEHAENHSTGFQIDALQPFLQRDGTVGLSAQIDF